MHRTLAGMAALLLAAGFAANGATPAAAAALTDGPDPQYGRLMLLLDSSGSMAEPASGGQTKIQAAKQALGRVIDDLPDDAEVGLRVFGAQVFSRKDAGACTDTQLVVQPGTDNRDELRDAVGDYKPYGETPIPAALEAAAGDIGDEGARSIVLVSDGESTCAPDPCDVARRLASKGINLQIDVVGLSVSGQARQQLQCIADAGHGTYYDADDARDIERNLVHVAERALRPFTLDGTPIQGGPEATPTSVGVGEWTDALGPVGSPQESRSYVFDRTTDGSTLRVTALTQGEKGDDGIKVEIAGPDGKVCNAGQVTRQFDTRDILAAEAVATPDVDGCGAPGSYRITVSRMTGSETQVPFGLRVSEEPPVTDPGPAPTADTELTAPHVSGPTTDVPGGASFANADELTDGKWSSTLVPGESLLYGFQLGFGQSARISVDFPDGTSAMKDVVGTTPPEARLALFNPMHAALAYPNVGQVPIGSVVSQRQTLLTATSTVSRGALDVSPFVGSVNGVKDTSMAGEYYLGVSMQAADHDLEVPFIISIEIVGDPGQGPTYADGATWSVEDGLTAGTGPVSDARQPPRNRRVRTWGRHPTMTPAADRVCLWLSWPARVVSSPSAPPWCCGSGAGSGRVARSRAAASGCRRAVRLVVDSRAWPVDPSDRTGRHEGMTTTTDASVRSRAEQHLRALVGRDDAELYDDQWAAIEALVVDRRRALVVQRTGWGKSAVYFVATLLLREGLRAGPTVIISPLLALMRNQIAAAERAGIRAVTINSTNMEQWSETHDAIQRGEVDVLLVSPERLNNPGFRDEVLPRLAATCGLLVVDEAHCISDWGHDFRPDYRRIRTLLAELPEGIPVLATTATANQRVTDDVAEQLGGDGSRDGRGATSSTTVAPLVLRGSLDRETLRLGVVRLSTAEQRLAWLADHLAEQPGSGIVYCLTVAATQQVADYLRSRGHAVRAYSGQTEQTERLALEQALLDGEVKALVATSALGMGFDASLGFVVNLGAPSSPVAYYQQVGRAGRGTSGPASVVLLPAIEDRDIWAYFASLAFPREQLVRETLAVLAEEGGVLSTPALEARVDLSRNRLETMLKVLDVDGAVRRVKGGWEGTGQEWAYDAERYQRVAEAREREQQAMLDYLTTDQCRMRFLRAQLDDPGADAEWSCGRCDNCGGLELPDDVSPKAVAEAADRLARPGVPIEPRKLWPTGLSALGIGRSGRIKAPADEGRAVARLTDLGHGQALRDLFRATDPAPLTVPVPLVRAVVATLAEWRPEPDVVVVAESTTRGDLLGDLAAGLSRYLQRPVVGRWAVTDPAVPPGAGATNSAQRVAAVTRRHGLVLDDPDAVRGRRVLLVDDLVGTGWSLTLAADALAAAGAEAVLPLTLAVSA